MPSTERTKNQDAPRHFVMTCAGTAKTLRGRISGIIGIIGARE
jgi:hypothetical protein